MKPGGRRIRRLLFNAVALASLALAAATGWLWRDSYRAGSGIFYEAASIETAGAGRLLSHFVKADSGRIEFFQSALSHPDYRKHDDVTRLLYSSPNGRQWTFDRHIGHGPPILVSFARPRFPNMHYQAGFRDKSNYWRYLVVPIWSALFLFLIVPAGWVYTWNARRLREQRLKGCCRLCGYDLRASKDACPECGEPIPASPLAGKAQA